MENRLFYLAFSASALVHGVVLAGLFFQGFPQNAKHPRTVEIVYPVPVRELPGRDLLSREVTGLKKPLKTASPFPGTIRGSAAPVSRVNKSPAGLDLPKPSSALKPVGEKRQVTVPFLKSEKITNPQYLIYHDKIRSLIRERAYHYVDDPRFCAGEVYLTFIVDSTGRIKAVHLIPEKSSGNPYLRDIGLRSIRESGPFDPFPAGLSYPELTFNVVIAFRLED